MSAAPPRVHVVTDDRVLARPDFQQRARLLAAAGPVALHLRSRTLTGRGLLELTSSFLSTGAVVVVNDRADVAHLAGVGVHLPAEGLPVTAARQLVGPHVPVGRSVHSADEAHQAAAEGADYVFLGPIWQTSSHPDRPPLGVSEIARAAPARVVAIGGITADRAAVCRAAGAYGVAVISAVWDAPEPGSAVRAMLLSFK
jgi:thiamine-phosphate diphosphorylase